MTGPMYERFPRTQRRRWSGTATSIAVVLAVVALIVAGVMAYRSTERDVSFIVTDKERVCQRGSDGDQECRYLVFTDEGTYRVQDSILIGRWSSSDLYGRIKRDHRYDARVIGWRIPLLSRYPNIVSIQESG